MSTMGKTLMEKKFKNNQEITYNYLGDGIDSTEVAFAHPTQPSRV